MLESIQMCKKIICITLEYLILKINSYETTKKKSIQTNDEYDSLTSYKSKRFDVPLKLMNQ